MNRTGTRSRSSTLEVVHRLSFTKEQRMKRARIGMVAIAALAVATVAFAQAKPDFSGTWTPDAPAAPPAGAPPAAGGGAPGGGGGCGGRGFGGAMAAQQSGNELTSARHRRT